MNAPPFKAKLKPTQEFTVDLDKYIEISIRTAQHMILLFKNYCNSLGLRVLPSTKYQILCNTMPWLNISSGANSTLVCESCCALHRMMCLIDNYRMLRSLWNDRLISCRMCKSSRVQTALLLVKGTNFQFHKRWSSICLCGGIAFDLATNDCTLYPFMIISQLPGPKEMSSHSALQCSLACLSNNSNTF